MKHACAKFVPHLLTDDQREQRQIIGRDMFERSCEDVQFLKNIVTGDKSWVYGYYPETKQQSSQWKGPTSPRPKKGRQVRSKMKVMLLAFFDSEGIVHHKYAPDGQTINKEFYMEVLQRLGESVRWKWLEKWQDCDWILYHNNVPANTSHLLQQFLAKHGTAQLQQPPYSTRSLTLWLFPIPKAYESSERTPIWGNGGHQTKLNEDNIRHPERGVRKMFPTAAETLGEVCSCGRELCWRQLGLKPHKPYLLHVLWSVRIVFEQTSYVY